MPNTPPNDLNQVLLEIVQKIKGVSDAVQKLAVHQNTLIDSHKTLVDQVTALRSDMNKVLKFVPTANADFEPTTIRKKEKA